MHAARCPNCGAQVEFRSTGAVETVCPFCRSVLLRRDLSVEKVGLEAELPPSTSPIQIGSGGGWRGKSFFVVGRVLYAGDDGPWNDWHIVFGDGTGAWLPDYRLLYAVMAPAPPPEPLPPRQNLQEKHLFDWHGTRYYVAALRRAVCLGGEGELPAGVRGAGEVTIATLMAPDGRCGFVHYSGAGTRLFLGEQAGFDDLHLTNLRSPAAADAGREAKALNCPNCGGALTLRTGALALSIACPNCLSVFDATRPELAQLRKFEEAQRIRPLLPLGARANFGGVDYEVVGFQVRIAEISMGAILYDWHEYVLFHPLQGFRFVTQVNGHWSFAGFLRAHPDGVPATRPGASVFGERYEYFSTSLAETIYVQGEFPWRLVVDEAAHVVDYIRPPFAITSDSTKRETTWFRGEYRTGREIWEAFHLPGSPPQAKGVGATQPKPRYSLLPIWTACGALLLFVLALAPADILVPAAIVSLAPAALLSLRGWYFEYRRWQCSDYNNPNQPVETAEPYMVSPYTGEPR